MLAYHVDWRALPQHLHRVSWPSASLALIALTSQFVIGPLKWQAALRMHGLHYDLGYLIRAYGIGLFFNNFLPSGMGGDAYRAMTTWPDREGSRAVSSVVIERMVGFAVLLAMGAIGALTMVEQSRYARMFVSITVAAAVAAGALIWALQSGYMKNLGERLAHHRFIAALTNNLRYLKRGGRHWLNLLAISVVFQLFAIASIYFLFESLGVTISVTACALVGAASGFATIIPLSINGLGVVEGSFVATALAFGAPYGASLAAAVLMRILILPQTLLFGLLYALTGAAKWSAKGSPRVAA